MINREQIEAIFERAKAYSWDIYGTCVWSYFLVSTDRVALIKSAQYLACEGYTFVGLLEPNPDDDDQETLYAQLDRIEAHSIESLHERNIILSKMAEQFKEVSYDGMEVGPVI